MDINYKGYRFTLVKGDIKEIEKLKETPVEQVNDANPGDITKDSKGRTVLGTQSSPYLICCIEDLVAFSDIVNNGEITGVDNYVKLDNSLNFKSSKSYIDDKRTSLTTYSLNGNILKNHTYPTNILTSFTTGSGWEPISIENEDGFLGTFDGNNKEIQNLYINCIEDSNKEVYYGLFSINDGVIQNLTVTGNVKGTYKTVGDDTEMYIASIVGDNYGTINNCVSNTAVTGIESGASGITIAGIAASNEGNITNCINNGTLMIKSEPQTYKYKYFYCAGITGNSYVGTINHCCNNGNIYINNTCESSVGGIVGICRKTKVLNCYNKGAITFKDTISETDVGGIVGFINLLCEIKNCYNLGVLSGSSVKSNDTLVGSIVGVTKDMNNIENNFDCIGIGAIGGENYYGVGDSINLTENEVLNYINTETHPTINTPTYAIDSRLNKGAYVKYDTSLLPNNTISTDLTGYNYMQYAYPSNYTGGWRVLLNDGNKVELISADGVNVGKSNTSKNMYLQGIIGFKNGIQALNNVANAFLNENLATSTRCIGFLSSNKNNTTFSLTYKPTDYRQISDIDCYIDYHRMLYSKTEKISNNNKYYMASRAILCDLKSIYYLRWSDGNNTVGGWEQYGIGEDGDYERCSYSCVRPVITLKNELEIKSGSGVSNDPYVLGPKS